MSSVLPFAPLPFDADPAAAFTDTIILPTVPRTVGGSSWFTVPVPGEYFYYPLSLNATLTTSPVVANRVVYYVLLDQNNQDIIVMGLTQVFGANLGLNFVWEISLATAYTDNGSSFFAPLPPRLLLPTHSVGVQVANLQAGDVFTGQVSTVKIPRRRPIDPRAALSPTPIVV